MLLAFFVSHWQTSGRIGQSLIFGHLQPRMRTRGIGPVAFRYVYHNARWRGACDGCCLLGDEKRDTILGGTMHRPSPRGRGRLRDGQIGPILCIQS
jgi:hypothetical protein